MKSFIRKLFFLSVTLILFIRLTAQVKIENIPDAQGKLTLKHNTLQFINSFKVLPTAKAASMAHVADKVMDVICRLPQISSPVGYNAKVNVVASDLGLKERESRLQIFCFLRYLIKDSRYTDIKESLDGADLYLKINDFDIFSQMGNYWQDCSDLKFPLFFEELPLIDSTNNYIEFQYKSDPVRVVLGRSEPLFVPLTRKEFLQFFVARGQEVLKTDKKALKGSLDGKDQITKMMATQNEKDKAYSAGTLKSIDYNIERWQKNIQQQEKENEEGNLLLNALTPQDAAAPARLDYNKKSNSQRMGGLDQLVPVGRREGTLLIKLNPAYYGHSAGTPAARIIVMYYAIPMLQYRKTPDYLEQAMLDVFKHIDYHQLKESMK